MNHFRIVRTIALRSHSHSVASSHKISLGIGIAHSKRLHSSLLVAPHCHCSPIPSRRTTTTTTTTSFSPRSIDFHCRKMSASAPKADPFKPAARVAGQRQDVWYFFFKFPVSRCCAQAVLIVMRAKRSIVNEAAAASPMQPIVNMGQGFLYVN